ncbi:MAG: D-glycero-beta-D-manno-heptose 1-phosphate adenylyltransferase [Bacteroidetes bacterium]|nr:MAG: D-glycero-beta-D-manno-heptose 1-phosphate adenylyltransferase [Bacteroidota bacterium]MBL1143814.1 D-glycero-beta-D-manno-heptose 1-phosphate adenylyltransferase [Bacteroidota bacterium]MCB0802544.1 D-glycero-beta-D-manno-heptose 1-phosphate adenylyltransferase [Flavobacteriales bacterium]NOG56615.1 D-glycero-beta-D-manno-heptose 1-phosphate adenylyltransferase [Bacteroidota bacterium]
MQSLEVIGNKIKNKDELALILNRWRFKDEKVVFTNGCFDILHLGHIDYLSKAADLGTKLIVGLNSDASVKTLNKGVNRPLQDEKSRAYIISALQFVDLVVIFNESTPYELIKLVQPDVLVKGSDYKIEQIVGYDILEAKGGEVRTIDFLEGFSTSSIVQKAQQQ